jgi:hypothetical protein
MNEQSKIKASTTTTQPTTYIRFESWVKEAKFEDVYLALNDIKGSGDKSIIHACAYGWDSTAKAIRMDSGILR